MCRWAKVSRSGYYEWRDRAPSATAARRQRLAAFVQWSFADSDGTYGYRRIHAHLARLGQRADQDTIRSILRDLGLIACQPRPWRPTTTIAGDTSRTKDLLRRDFSATAPAMKLVGDITYIRTWEGWLYLATVLDCHTKKVVGYAMADHLRTSLIVDALETAASRITIRPKVTIFHSDRGWQYIPGISRRYRRTRDPQITRTHRNVLRQCLGRVLQRHSEERTRQPHRISNATPRTN
jgi:putative transposase